MTKTSIYIKTADEVDAEAELTAEDEPSLEDSCRSGIAFYRLGYMKAAYNNIRKRLIAAEAKLARKKVAKRRPK